MELYADLHLHSTFSDGSLTPEELVKECYKKDIYAISLTDHDNIGGVEIARKSAQIYKIKFIPGVELSTQSEFNETEEIHILGYYINENDPMFNEKLLFFQKAREERAKKIRERLATLGININERTIKEISQKGSIGRMHFARILVEKEIVSSIKEAFEKYLSYGKPAFIPRLKLSTKDAIKLILSNGGIPVVAHPVFGANDKNIISRLRDYGLKGIEVFYPEHNQSHIAKYINWAEEFNLCITGGSDFHGTTKGRETKLGENILPYRYVELLQQCNKLLNS